MFSFMLAAYRSNSGKTVLSSAICCALQHRGLRVRPFKCGPDYIDQIWLSKSANEQAYNLDSVLLDKQSVCELYQTNIAGTDGAIIEGVMGLFDGVNPITFEGSSYEVAKIIGTPVVLVIDAAGLATSVAAIIMGVKALAKDVHITGVILNKISSERQEQLLRRAILAHVPDVKIYGAIPKENGLDMSSRHLGLTIPDDKVYAQFFQHAANIAERYIDLDLLMADTTCKSPPAINKKSIIANKKAYVAYDEAFMFYYPTTFELLQRKGYEIIYFSPLRNDTFGDADLILLGGGYPELHATELDAAGATRMVIQEHHRRNVPIFGECGGFMYMAKSLTTTEGLHRMLGVLDIDIGMTNKRQRLGYVEIAVDDNIYRGHTFHYSKVSRCGEHDKFKLVMCSSGDTIVDGYRNGSAYGGYAHFMPYGDDSGLLGDFLR